MDVSASEAPESWAIRYALTFTVGRTLSMVGHWMGNFYY